jgi:hypothetical protein
LILLGRFNGLFGATPARDRIRTTLIRTTISLDEREYELAKQESRALGISVAEFVRRAVREARSPAREAPWMRFVGLVETGDSKSSQSMDELVYGPKD